MKPNTIGNGAILVAVVASTATSLAAWHYAGQTAREKEEALSRQKSELAQLATDNAQLSNELSEVTGPALSDGQMMELLRLRAEAGKLRRQTNEIHKLVEANRRLEAGAAPGQKPAAEAKAEFEKELATELMDAARKIIAALPHAQCSFAADHNGKAAIDFSDLRKYFPAVNGQRMPGLYSFQFVSDEGPQPGENLILRESRTHHALDGQNARIYAFSNGQAEEVTPTDTKERSKFFEEWEKQHLNAAGP